MWCEVEHSLLKTDIEAMTTAVLLGPKPRPGYGKINIAVLTLLDADLSYEMSGMFQRIDRDASGQSRR